MRCTKNFVPLAVVALLLMPACGKQPAPAPPADIAAAPPEGAQVHQLTPDQWQEGYCAGATDWTFNVPNDAWIAFPVAWVATDEATARGNWEHMDYRIWVNDRELQAPEGAQLQVDSVSFDCPDRTVTGFAATRVVYLPPVTEARHYRIQYVFNDDVNDGWNAYAKGTELNMTVTLRPQGT